MKISQNALLSFSAQASTAQSKPKKSTGIDINNEKVDGEEYGYPQSNVWVNPETGQVAYVIDKWTGRRYIDA